MTRVGPILAMSIVSLLVLGNAATLSPEASAVSLPWEQYVSIMQHSVVPHGCFESDYPSTALVPTACSPPSKIIPAVGGSSYDEAAKAPSSTYIGIENGSFSSTTGITWETDATYGKNSYSLQINSQVGFSCSWSTDCWEQFVYQNYGDTQGSYGALAIWYILANYGSPCPSGGPSGGIPWYYYQGSCYSEVSQPTSTPSYPLSTYISKIEFSGSSDFGGSGNDQATLCIKGVKCYFSSNTDTVMNLHNVWFVGEYNVLGLGDGSTAEFTPAAAITPNDNEKTTTGTAITPTCDRIVYTAEANNMTLYSCSVVSNTLSFTEANAYYLTMQTSGCCGTVSPSSGWYPAKSSVTITGTPSPGCYSFYEWTGSGSGSYTGYNNPATVTMKGAITETGDFVHLCAPSH